MLLRVFLLSLPFCALFLAGLLSPPGSSSVSTAARGVIALTVTIALTAGFLVSRYGNETIDVFTRQEVDAVAHLYRIAPRGSLLLAGDANLPWKYREYGGYEYKTLGEYELDFSGPNELAHGVARILESSGGREGYFIVTRSQRETVRLLGVPSPSKSGSADGSDGVTWLQYLEQAVQDSPEFEVLFENRDGTIFTLRS